MVVTDRRRGGTSLSEVARRARAAGAQLLQVREKDLTDGALYAAVAAVVDALAGGPRTLSVFVNGRPDVAEAAGADGVQLPEDGLPVAEVRRAFPRLKVGASCHSREAASRAAAEGADHVVFGPVFATPGKEARAAGLPALAQIAAHSPVPVFAIGGVTPEEAAGVRDAGAAGVAAIRPFLAGDVAQVVSAYVRAWTRGR